MLLTRSLEFLSLSVTAQLHATDASHLKIQDQIKVVNVKDSAG